MKIKRIDAALAAVFAALGLAACGDHVGDNRTAGQKIDNAVTNTVATTQEAIDNAGQKASELAIAAGKSAEEAAITASIKTDLLKDPELSALKIEVDTSGSVVTLNGVAPTEKAADRAGRIAIAVNGVSEVRNHVVARKS